MSNPQMVYCLLKGTAKDAKPYSQNPRAIPHYHILIENVEREFDIAVNIASADPNAADKRVLYAVKRNITPPRAAQLLAFESIVQNLPQNSPLRIDYVKDGLVTAAEMDKLPLFSRHDPTDGQDAIMQLVAGAMENPDATLYAFGHRYTNTSPRNAAWGFRPDDGVHNIHMNQGNYTGNHDDENARSEDGALMIHYRSANRWDAVYVAFQTQSWDNGADGYPKDDQQHRGGQ